MRSSSPLIAKAVTATTGRAWSSTVEDFDKLFAVNVRAPFFLVQQFLPIMSKGSSVIFVSSLGALSAVIRAWPAGFAISTNVPGVAVPHCIRARGSAAMGSAPLVDQIDDQCGPPGLVARADVGAVVAVEVLVKQEVIAPTGIVGELRRPAAHGRLRRHLGNREAVRSSSSHLSRLEVDARIDPRIG